VLPVRADVAAAEGRAVVPGARRGGSPMTLNRGSRMEDGGSRIEKRGSRMEDGGAILNPQSSILDPRSSSNRGPPADTAARGRPPARGGCARGATRRRTSARGMPRSACVDSTAPATSPRTAAALSRPTCPPRPGRGRRGRSPSWRSGRPGGRRCGTPTTAGTGWTRSLRPVLAA
jgi:hypothetical protein